MAYLGVHEIETSPYFKSAAEARAWLGLEKLPEVGMRMEVPQGVFSEPSIVDPYVTTTGEEMPGGGIQRTGEGPIPISSMSWWDLQP